MTLEDVRIFAGSASRSLAQAICSHLGVRLCAGQTLRFADGNLFVRVQENVRGRDVFVIQSTAFASNDHFMELLFWIDAFKRASAACVTAVVPYFSYAKGDKKDEPRVSIRARVCADAMEAAGVDRILTMDLHAPQIQGFFKVPVDDLYAVGPLCEAVRRTNVTDLVVVSPDAGFAKKARRYADALGAPLAIADKQRPDHTDQVVIGQIMGNVRGRQTLIVDDFTIHGGTLVEVAKALVEAGATRVVGTITHGLITEKSIDRLMASPIERLWITDTVEAPSTHMCAKLQVVSVAPLLAEAIMRIHRRESISVLFDPGLG